MKGPLDAIARLLEWWYVVPVACDDGWYEVPMPCEDDMELSGVEPDASELCEEAGQRRHSSPSEEVPALPVQGPPLEHPTLTRPRRPMARRPSRRQQAPSTPAHNTPLGGEQQTPGAGVCCTPSIQCRLFPEEEGTEAEMRLLRQQLRLVEESEAAATRQCTEYARAAARERQLCRNTVDRADDLERRF